MIGVEVKKSWTNLSHVQWPIYQVEKLGSSQQVVAHPTSFNEFMPCLMMSLGPQEVLSGHWSQWVWLFNRIEVFHENELIVNITQHELAHALRSQEQTYLKH